uniref:SHSP domain-containing protein n=1 Tax=Heligmosomoides polygyrus TaxID=6339 RepID=A0A8L8KCR2_HELPZ
LGLATRRYSEAVRLQFWRDTDHWWRDWPSDWPRMDAVMPRFTSHLDRLDRNWRNDPFWQDIYPRWAEPIFKEGIDVHSNIINDERRFAVEVDCYQFKPEEIQVKTQDDTLMIEGRHEDVRDRDNFTKMYFVRKYQMPRDVDHALISSNIDSRGRLTVEAPRRYSAIAGRDRVIPIEGGGRSMEGSAHRSHSSSSHRMQHEFTLYYRTCLLHRRLHSNSEPEQRSPGRDVFDSIRMQFERGYRVESPVSTSTGILRNADRPESRSESVRSVQILRKTFG